MPDSAYPRALVYNRINDKVYCANSGRDEVSVIGGTSNEVVATVGVGSSPWALCHNPRGNKVYCANWGSYPDCDSTVTVIDGTTNQVIATVVTGPGP